MNLIDIILLSVVITLWIAFCCIWEKFKKAETKTAWLQSDVRHQQTQINYLLNKEVEKKECSQA